MSSVPQVAPVIILYLSNRQGITRSHSLGCFSFLKNSICISSPVSLVQPITLEYKNLDASLDSLGLRPTPVTPGLAQHESALVMMAHLSP